jgi:hypothetical protein
VRLDLRHDQNITVDLIKMYYLFATGFDGNAKSKLRPYIDCNIFNWANEPSDTVKERLNILTAVYTYLYQKSITSHESLKKTIQRIAYDLYDASDWRSFAMDRENHELFYHVDDKKLLKPSNDTISIFDYVKNLDVSGQRIDEIIHRQYRKNMGAIGKNTKSGYTMYHEFVINAAVKLNGSNAADFTFYTNDDKIFKIYRYVDFIDKVHHFETLQFDICEKIQRYIDYAKAIKDVLHMLPNEIKTDPIYSKNYSELKEKCGKIYEVDVGSYYNTIITTCNINIDIDLADENIVKGIELLHLNTQLSNNQTE